MSDELETKLSAARTRLILDRPFLGALVLRMPMKAADPKWCATIGTDARAFYYNPAYIDGLTLEQTQFALAHEALHCALSHFARREHRVRERWDVACDLAINPILIRERPSPPCRKTPVRVPWPWRRNSGSFPVCRQTAGRSRRRP